jgi:hypothetical protein
MISLGATEALVDLTWSTWNTTRAVAAGVMLVNDCSPDCAEGHITNVPVTVTLGSVTGSSAIDGGHYTTLRVTDQNDGALVYSTNTDDLAGASGGIQGNY